MISEEWIREANTSWKDADPGVLIQQGLELAIRPVVTTNFRPYEAAILHACVTVQPEIPVLWCDTGYNTAATYKHAEYLIDRLQLCVHPYVPQRSRAHREALSAIPELDTPEHQLFTHEVKLEPFRRAMAEHKPDVWFTNLRQGQTALRDSLGIFSLSGDGVLKVSPFYYWSDRQMDDYLKTHALPNEFDYHDPTKGLAHRECGLHL
ncbi:phosphoadenosine phosphosulfate reductase domain-containing protein [Croceiramulus getboli]|nr:phosphoadenosine phosphosulfate reductase family protein [Flavobacteriaceae bacterium YJPT1-3]